MYIEKGISHQTRLITNIDRLCLWLQVVTILLLLDFICAAAHTYRT